MSLLSGPPYPPIALRAISDYARAMGLRAQKLHEAGAELRRQMPDRLGWSGPAAQEYGDLLRKQVQKLRTAEDAARDGRVAALDALDEARRINKGWQREVEAYVESMKQQSR